MPVIQESVVIRRPAEVVFDYLSRAANLAVWDASVVNAEQIGSAPTAVGIHGDTLASAPLRAR